MTTEDIDAVRARIHAEASAHAEGTVYTMTNTYLSRTQKSMVEAVYQFPLAVMGYAFGLLTLLADQSIYFAFLNASFIGGLAWLLARYKGRYVAPVGLYMGGWIETVINLAMAAYALYLQRWGLAAIFVLGALGATSVVMLPMWLWGVTSKGLHAKYAIAKRMWGMTFPFEAQKLG